MSTLGQYCREDIAGVLDSVDLASGRTAGLVLSNLYHAKVTDPDDRQVSRDSQLYRQGFRDALVAVAAAFGINPAGYSIEMHGEVLPAPDTFHWER